MNKESLEKMNRMRLLGMQLAFKTCIDNNQTEAFTNDEPVKISYINTDKPTILTEGVYFKNPTNGQRKIPFELLNALFATKSKIAIPP